MAMVVNNEFEIGQSVFLKTDEDQNERIVTQISILHGGVIHYCLSCGTVNTWHYSVEIAAEKNIVKTTSS